MAHVVSSFLDTSMCWASQILEKLREPLLFLHGVDDSVNAFFVRRYTYSATSETAETKINKEICFLEKDKIKHRFTTPHFSQIEVEKW